MMPINNAKKAAATIKTIAKIGSILSVTPLIKCYKMLLRMRKTPKNRRNISSKA
jgi:hypothetical protein